MDARKALKLCWCLTRIRVRSGVVGDNGATSGGSVVSVVGGSFGDVDSSVSVRVGGSSGERCEWVSDSCVTAVLGSGVGGSRGVSVSVVGQVGSVSGSVSYDGGSVSGVTGQNVGVSGGGSVSVVGSGLGAVSSSVCLGV